MEDHSKKKKTMKAGNDIKNYFSICLHGDIQVPST